VCGISGVLTTRGRIDGARDRVRSMMRAIAHRGPDGEGIWHDPTIPLILGHNRLAILDRSSAGAQPMLSSSGRYVVTFNGEIYNFPYLRHALDHGLGGPLPWRGHADTEVLVEAINAWGVENALAKIEGMFAVGVWDRTERTLWLLRDRMGEKPLYYGLVEGEFAFASELQALRAVYGSKLEVNSAVLCEYLRAGYIPAPDTIYRKVFKLPAGNLLRIDGASQPLSLPKPVPYWTIRDVMSSRPSSDTPNDAHAASERMEIVLRQAVAERMVSDVPVGAFLSGGVDSSLVVAMMAQESRTPVRTFTIAFEDQRYDESRYARLVATHLRNIKHTEDTVTAADALALIPLLGGIFSEPFADPAQIPTYLLAKLARQDVTVALSGEGADELFGGYDKYFAAQSIWRLLSRVPRQLRRLLSQALAAPSVHAWDGLLRHGSRAYFERHRVNGDRIHKLATTLSAQDRREFYALLAGNWRPARDAVHLSQDAIQSPLLDIPSLGFVHEMMATDQMSSLPDGILTKVDRATMAVGLESRAPFLAESVVKFAWSLPVQLKVNRRQGKLVLRNALAKYLPPELCNREKMGFSVPLDSWLRGGLRPWAEELLEANRLEDAGFRSSSVRKKWLEHLSGTQNWQFALWPVLMWQAFFAETRTTVGDLQSETPSSHRVPL
jgi:asparagine synthase (glutamine-hydrolysing)